MLCSWAGLKCDSTPNAPLMYTALPYSRDHAKSYNAASLGLSSEGRFPDNDGALGRLWKRLWTLPASHGPGGGPGRWAIERVRRRRRRERNKRPPTKSSPAKRERCIIVSSNLSVSCSTFMGWARRYQPSWARKAWSRRVPELKPELEPESEPESGTM